MEYPCVLVRLHEDGQIEVDKDLYLKYEDGLEIPHTGYVTLILEKELFTDIYIVANTEGQTQTYLEGFLIGRNIDYVARKNISSSDEYKKLIQTAYNKLMVKE